MVQCVVCVSIIAVFFLWPSYWLGPSPPLWSIYGSFSATVIYVHCISLVYAFSYSSPAHGIQFILPYLVAQLINK